MATAAEKLAGNLNFGALGKATELRNRLLFTLGALIVFRLGTFLPIPGINPIASMEKQDQHLFLEGINCSDANNQVKNNVANNFKCYFLL